MAIILDEEQKARFASLAPRGEPDACWLWQGRRNSKGYGQFAYILGRDRRHVTASRVAWSIANNAPFPDDLFACHSCDNPPCVNPAHIWPGTREDNLSDARAKGRMPAYKTHCDAGHELAGDNVRISDRGRKCRTCERAERRSMVPGNIVGIKRGIARLPANDVAELRRYLNAQVQA